MRAMSAVSIAARKLHTAARQPLFVWLWLVPVWIAIGLASAIIVLVPFRHLAPLLGQNLGTGAFVPCAGEAQVRRAQQIGRTIAIAARYAPFRSNCYPQALVACALCTLWGVPYALFFGVRIEEAGKLDAHAWVVSGRVTLTGGAISFARFNPLACFVAPPILPR
jgi:hypothetical protein